MDDTPDLGPGDAAAARAFLARMWRLENSERPGFIIGDVGGRVIGGDAVRSALFSTGGTDTVRDRLQDPAKYLRAQMEEIRSLARLRGDFVPALCPALGVVALPSAFGCEVVWWDRDFPAVRPAIRTDPREVYGLPEPSVSAAELGRILSHTRHFLAHSDGALPIRLADIQGPLDNAALIFGHTAFLEAMYTHPREVHHLLQKITDLTIRFIRAQRAVVVQAGAEFVPSMFQPWIPDGFGVSVANDECTLISAAQHNEFSVPYLNMLSEEFGGVYVHSCGNWAHQIPSLLRVRNLRGVEFGASETPIDAVAPALAGKTVLACRIGLHRDLTFRGMADFVRRARAACPSNRGLFLHVDITNGLVPDDWPTTDLAEIYALVGAS